MVSVELVANAEDRLDAPALLASPPAKQALVRLAAELRSAGYDNRATHDPLTSLALGRSVDPTRLSEVVGDQGVEALCSAGAADRSEGGIALRFALFAAGSVLALVPRFPTPDPELVYLGPDSFWLLRTAWRLAPGGDVAVDLGTGTGYLAAVLRRRYRTVVATDFLAGTAAVAALTMAVNDGGYAGSLVADVAGGLRRGCADLVTANPPWVPSPPDRGGAGIVFAEGGPSGTELPLRFIQEGSALLRPGGLGLFQCLDVTRPDGARPLADVCRSLAARGLIAQMRPVSRAGVWPRLEDRLGNGPFVADAQLVTVIVKRPG
jgi:release factor glutamine methyltransferase